MGYYEKCPACEWYNNLPDLTEDEAKADPVRVLMEYGLDGVAAYCHSICECPGSTEQEVGTAQSHHIESNVMIIKAGERMREKMRRLTAARVDRRRVVKTPMMIREDEEQSPEELERMVAVLLGKQPKEG